MLLSNTPFERHIIQYRHCTSDIHFVVGDDDNDVFVVVVVLLLAVMQVL